MKQNSKILTKQNLDLIFAKVRADRITKRELGANKIDFQQFLQVVIPGGLGLQMQRPQDLRIRRLAARRSRPSATDTGPARSPPD